MSLYVDVGEFGLLDYAGFINGVDYQSHKVYL